MEKLFAVLAALFVISVYPTYWRQVIKKSSVPNPATWLIWLVVHAMNTATYFLVTEGNIWKTMIAITTTALLLLLKNNKNR